jgi:hypothetical protein
MKYCILKDVITNRIIKEVRNAVVFVLMRVVCIFYSFIYISFAVCLATVSFITCDYMLRILVHLMDSAMERIQRRCRSPVLGRVSELAVYAE